MLRSLLRFYSENCLNCFVTEAHRCATWKKERRSTVLQCGSWCRSNLLEMRGEFTYTKTNAKHSQIKLRFFFGGVGNSKNSKFLTMKVRKLCSSTYFENYIFFKFVYLLGTVIKAQFQSHKLRKLFNIYRCVLKVVFIHRHILPSKSLKT